MITLNGKKIDEKKYKNLKELILFNKYNLENIVVLVNEDIIKKEEWEKYKLKDNDIIEIVGFVGGG